MTMKPVIIIAIAVVCSVVAVLGVLVVLQEITYSDISDPQEIIPALFFQSESFSTSSIDILENSFVPFSDYSQRTSQELHLNIDALNSDIITIEVFDELITIEKDFDIMKEDDSTWIGKIIGMEYPSVVIIINDQKISGHIITLTNTYMITHLTDDNYIIQDIDTSLFPNGNDQIGDYVDGP